MSVKARVRSEFAKRKLWTNCCQTKLFTTAQWPIPPILYVIYRHIILIYFWAWAIFSFFRAFDDMSSTVGTKFFIFLTVQSFLLLCLHTLISAVLATTYYLKNIRGCHCRSATLLPSFYHDWHSTNADCHHQCDESHPAISLLYKIHWILYNVTANAALLVTIGYWGVVYPYLAELRQPGSLQFAWDFSLHAANTIYFAVDLMLSATPVCLMHWWMGVLYGAYYAVFSLLYWAGGGKGLGEADYIYPMIDYTGQPGMASATILLGLAIVVPILQLLLWLFYRARVSLYKCYLGRNTAVSMESSNPDINIMESEWSNFKSISQL